MGNLKTLTLLHSNDLHGDFFAESVDDTLMGGVSMLSGYVNKVRNEENNVIYAIAGDMFRGSVIDAEFKGISTIEIMNLIAPDVVGIGNHEVDYGVPHLLFLEKCANFPIINANMFIKSNMTRLFKDHLIIEIGGMKVLFVAIITEDILAQTKSDQMISTFLDVGEAAEEVGKICDLYNAIDIDFTVLLTHIGFDEDLKLAEKLNPDWGVDVIIGGHSHTLPDKPAVVNDILIVQAGVGTDRIGRFDLTIDTDTNSVHAFEWKTVAISEDNCPRDLPLEDVILNYQNVVDKKYGKILARLPAVVTHPSRVEETSMGNLVCDIFRDAFGVDIAMIGSGSFRTETLGPIVRVSDLMAAFPYDDVIYKVVLSGAQLKQAFLHILRDEAYTGHTEFYQFSHGLNIVYNRDTKTLEKFTLQDLDISAENTYSVALQNFHYANIQEFLGIPVDELQTDGKPKVLAVSCVNVLQEGLIAGMGKHGKMGKRLTIK